MIDHNLRGMERGAVLDKTVRKMVRSEFCQTVCQESSLGCNHGAYVGANQLAQELRHFGER